MKNLSLSLFEAEKEYNINGYLLDYCELSPNEIRHHSVILFIRLNWRESRSEGGIASRWVYLIENPI